MLQVSSNRPPKSPLSLSNFVTVHYPQLSLPPPPLSYVSDGTNTCTHTCTVRVKNGNLAIVLVMLMTSLTVHYDELVLMKILTEYYDDPHPVANDDNFIQPTTPTAAAAVFPYTAAPWSPKKDESALAGDEEVLMTQLASWPQIATARARERLGIANTMNLF
ncbi:hypothetical protein T492DRAFT_1138779 [Pavlovales sp. CCMP2436]|nr:hypothetical protein T492DRAFT_1138779 [Pavlovales sp. CCMP2436]